MAMNRIQFQPGLSLPAFLQQFGVEAQCEDALEQVRWPQGFRCSCCGREEHCLLHVGARKIFQCWAFRFQTSLIAGEHSPGIDGPVLGDLLDQPSQNRLVHTGTEAVVGR